MPSPAEIRRIRESLGLTQEAAGELIGVSRVTWARWEATDAKVTSSPSVADWRLFLHITGLQRVPFGMRANKVTRSR